MWQGAAGAEISQEEAMKAETEITVARALIHRHGLRAAAVATEHVAQARAQNDRETAAHWSGVARAVSELQTEARVVA